MSSDIIKFTRIHCSVKEQGRSMSITLHHCLLEYPELYLHFTGLRFYELDDPKPPTTNVVLDNHDDGSVESLLIHLQT